MSVNPFRVIVAGGRNFKDFDLLQAKCNVILTSKLPDVEIVSGCAQGADALGEMYAAFYNLIVAPFNADWDNMDATPCLPRKTRSGRPYNALAGNIRNKQMAEYAHALICFWDGKSKGSADMIKIMQKMNKPVRIVRY